MRCNRRTSPWVVKQPCLRRRQTLRQRHPPPRPCLTIHHRSGARSAPAEHDACGDGRDAAAHELKRWQIGREVSRQKRTSTAKSAPDFLLLKGRLRAAEPNSRTLYPPKPRRSGTVPLSSFLGCRVRWSRMRAPTGQLVKTPAELTGPLRRRSSHEERRPTSRDPHRCRRGNQR
jgi:hypothetical protein